MSNKPPVFDIEQFVPSLRQELEEHPLNLNAMIRAAVPVKDPEKNPAPVPDSVNRNVIYLTDGKDFCVWVPESLESLFRGDKPAPRVSDVPALYTPEVMVFEVHVAEISNLFGPPRDDAMRELYSNLRRHPDGRSFGFVHDYMWRAAALMLGTRPLSKGEFEAILSRLERSCRTFGRSPTSRNYAESLQTLFRSKKPGS